MRIELLLLFLFANFAICSAIGWACLCRINLMHGRETRLIFRLKYSVLLTAAGVAGFVPMLFPEAAPLALAALSGAVLFQLAGGARAWRGGVPEYAKSDPAPFDDRPHPQTGAES